MAKTGINLPVRVRVLAQAWRVNLQKKAIT